LSLVANPKRAPLSEMLLTGDLEDLSSVRLAGSRCTSCGETVLGKKELCTNCGRDTIEHGGLSDRGKIWTYTVIRHLPPGDYKGPKPFVPFGVGLIELPDGVLVMAPLAVVPEDLQIGLPVKLQASVREQDGVVVFAFARADANE
jgi:uncharacterized protein